jgi:lipid-binding SYLF domain-containing protein
MKSSSSCLSSFLLELFLLALAIPALAREESESDIARRLNASTEVLNQIMASPDKTIPNQVLSEAKCIAIMPSLVKVALGIGGRHGKGVATCRTATGWSAPAPISLSGGSIGLQIGGQSVDLVMVVMDQNALVRLLSSKFKIGTDISGRAGPIGPETGETDWRHADVLSYSKSRGAFVGIDLKGAALKQDKDSTVALYGRYIPFASLLAGKVRPPAESHTFLATVRKYMAAASHRQG